ncbi:hypothetical protein FFI89_000935 [Bradyrhizobium sp. KBS0727]|uniref:hypothetical protein n=1 Tax=unclassified Bradyrhizobium TaxID=2631580 RepID=UPI00110DD04F|nr:MULTISPECIES: hypothetical protein [unclassified Bradyrhizobium]QDW35829.1 hypothetical protein FFI71_000935 [Bradyrhizobium sp. KBS0725]QDW42429.1 hypothetical protein FFI89_000935 [Bradyrhizobium sp. KBS0727]
MGTLKPQKLDRRSKTLTFLDRDDTIGMNEIFEDARRSVPMPDLPRSLQDQIATGPMSIEDIERPSHRTRARFDQFDE